MSGSEPFLTRVAPEVSVADLTEALDYYRNILGFRTMAVTGGDYAVVQRDDVAIHLFSDRSAAPIALHVFTQHVDRLCAELEGRGARIKQRPKDQPWGIRDFRVLDPFGNELKFSEPSAH